MSKRSQVLHGKRYIFDNPVRDSAYPYQPAGRYLLVCYHAFIKGMMTAPTDAPVWQIYEKVPCGDRHGWKLVQADLTYWEAKQLLSGLKKVVVTKRRAG